MLRVARTATDSAWAELATRLEERPWFVGPSRLVEIRCQEPAGFIQQQGVDADCEVAPGSVQRMCAQKKISDDWLSNRLG